MDKQIARENKAWMREAKRERREKLTRRGKQTKQRPKVVKPGQMYVQRRVVLKRLGFADYRQYIVSPLWKTIRMRVLRDRPWCELCQAKRSTQVHHQSYSEDVMSGEEDTGLVATCSGCHHFVEFDGDTKRQDTEVRRITRATRQKARRIAAEKAELDRQFDDLIARSD